MTFWGESQRKTTPFLGLLISTLVLIYVIFSWWRKRADKVKFMLSIPGHGLAVLLSPFYFLLDTLFCENVHYFIRAQIDRYPKITGLWIKSTPYVITSDRSIINAVLTSQQNVRKQSDYKYFKANSSGIFVTNGPNWRSMRKTINPCFKTEVLSSFGGGFSYHTKVFLESLQKHAIDGDLFDVFAPVHLCTFDFICENMMGCRLDFQKKNLLHLSSNSVTAGRMIFDRMYKVLYWSDFIYSLIGMQSKLNIVTSELRVIGREVRQFSEGIDLSFIKTYGKESILKGFNRVAKIVVQQIKRRNESKNSGCKTDGTLQIFMEILLQDLDSGNITKDQVIEETIDMITAGSITTATVNAWVFKLLAMRPDLQEKVYREIVEICGRREEVTIADLSGLNYLDMVIKETLRHFSVPFVGRLLTSELIVDEKTSIPAGVVVVSTIFDLHHDPEYWSKPGEFFPEHFSPENENGRPKGVFVPFLNGPRACPGSKYAIQSMKFLLANTILNFELTTDEKAPMDFRKENYHNVYMLHPTSGFGVKVKNRHTGQGIDCFS